jgi:glyoxylase-like metal-dependent hydrolase (beta-lactamase superfamily II)
VSRIIPGELFYPQPTAKLTENLFTICDRGDTNIYIYTDGIDTICIDVGYISNNYLKDDFQEIGIDPGSISSIFLTHTDMDHAGALDKDSESDWLNNTKLYMGQAEERLIKKMQRRRFFFYTPIEISRKYNLVNHRDIIKVGNIKVEALHTPGHTLGHMSYLINDTMLFTGDLLLKKDKVEPFYRFWNMDHNLDKKSIKKIAKLQNIQILCTAHSKCSFNFKKAIREWIE